MDSEEIRQDTYFILRQRGVPGLGNSPVKNFKKRAPSPYAALGDSGKRVHGFDGGLRCARTDQRSGRREEAVFLDAETVADA